LSQYTDSDEIAEPKRLIMPDDDWSAEHAKSVVLGDFDRASNYRHQNHDWRWQRADRRYLGVVPRKFWEGTQIERSHISVMTTYQQVEALTVIVMQALFGDDPWFEALPIGKTTPEAARISRDIIAAQLYKSRVRKVLKLALKSGYIYGNGLLESCWHYEVIKKKVFRVEYVPETNEIVDPFTGQAMPLPSGRMKRDVVEEIQTIIDNRPILRCIPITQFFVDPNCPTTDPQDAGFTITRTLEPIGELINMRDEPGYDVPDDEELLQWSKDKPGDQGDLTQQEREASRDGNWQPGIDQSVDPYAARVEVLRYKTKHRVVWVVNRKHVVYNQTNMYGRMMQYSPFYTELIDRFYGMAITDVVNGEQLLQEGIVNARVDELAMALHPPTKVKRGNQTPAYQLRMRPGALAYSDDPKNDLVRDFPTNVTVNAFQEVDASNLRTQKNTGLTDIAVVGVSSGNNPGARSATGAGIQGQAAKTRVQGQVENLVDEVLEPILHDFHLLDQHHLDPDQRIEAVDGTMLDPLALFSAEVRYYSRAASRMQSRLSLSQNLAQIMQHAMNPALIQQLAERGETVDFAEIFQMLVDVTGHRKRAEFIRKLTPQEIKARQESNPSEKIIEMQMQRERLDQMAEMDMNKNEMQLMQQIVKAKSAEKQALISARSKNEPTESD
jgi:hypothetical protein